ncbi:MAG: PqqD family protein [Methanothrix sp.]
MDINCVKGEYMVHEVEIDSAYIASEDVVAREIEGEFILVPLTSGIGDMEDEIYTLNETGRAIWERLDGKRSLREVAKALNADFQAQPGEIEQDIAGLVNVLFERKMVVQA